MTTRRTALLALLLLLPQPLFAEGKSKSDQTDIVYGHKDGLALTMDLYRPEKPNGAAVVFMVSGGWYSRWAPPAAAKPLLHPYIDKGFTVFAVRHGSSPRYSIPEIVGDVRKSIKFIKDSADRFDIDPKRIGVLGMSAGGHLALMLGTTEKDIGAVVALVPPTDLRVAVWEAPESLPAYKNFPALNLPLKEAGKYSPLVHVSEDDAPSLVIMGGKDELVPPKHGEWIAKAFKEKNVKHKLIVFPDAGHGLEGVTTRGRVFRESVDWFVEHLAKSKASE